MRTTTAVLAAAAALALAVPGAAQAHEAEVPEHGHMLVLGLQFHEDGSVSYRKCVDIAAGRALAVHVHHDGLHAGRAGDALRKAGNFPVPTAPLTPWRGCADLAKAFPR